MESLNVQSTAQNVTTRSRPRKTTVPDVLKGFSLQATRAVERLLSEDDGAFVCLEAWDDVAVVNGDELVAEQVKAGTSRNPIADAALPLWKTFANWVVAVHAGDVDLAHTRFEIYTVRHWRGKVADSFAAAADATSAAAAVLSARSVVERHTKRTPQGELSKYVSTVFEDGGATLASVVERFALTHGGTDLYGEMDAKFRLVSPALVRTVTAHAIGWTKIVFDEALLSNRVAVISVDEFWTELRSFVRKLDHRTILGDFAPPPDRTEIEAELPSKLYIRQLELIESDEDDLLTAASDFIRAKLHRAIWAEKGLVNRSSYGEFTSELIRHWKARDTVIPIAYRGCTDIEHGKLLFAECCGCRPTLENLPVPDYFAPGSLHALANDLIIGWHPKYRERLQESARINSER
jgi:hypothetical protein